MRVLTLAAFVGAASMAATCSLAAAGPSDPAMSQRIPSLHRRGSRTLHAPPSKRSPATDDVQASIVALAATDPVAAAIAAQGLDGIKDNTDGGDLAGNTLIPGDSESNEDPQQNQYPWNQNVPFQPNADASAGSDASDPDAQGWAALPALPGFNLVRDQVIKGNATLPFYITGQYDPTMIKKAVIIMPGKVSVFLDVVEAHT